MQFEPSRLGRLLPAMVLSVLVNGVFVIGGGEHTGERSGMPLMGKGFREN